MDPFLYVQEEYDNVKRALDESLRYDYGPGQTADYYEECQFRLSCIKEELEQLRATGTAPPVSSIVAQLWDLANRLTLIERSHLGEFSWPFADAIGRIASSLLLEEEGLRDPIKPIIHMLAEGTSYQISSEYVLGPNKRRRLYTVAFPRQLKHHVLMHALFGHELGHATFFSTRPLGGLLAGTPASRNIVSVLRREGPLRDVSSTMAWLRSSEAPEPVTRRIERSSDTLQESNLDHWLVELVSDLFGLAIFGPSFAAAHRTFLEPSCKTPHEFEISKTSHPAYLLRRTVLADAMDALGWLKPVCEEGGPTRRAEEGLIEYIGARDETGWASVFSREQLGESFGIIGRHFEATGTKIAARPEETVLVALVRRITAHLPPIREEVDEEGVSTTYEARLDEQLYAGWTYWLGRDELDPQPLSFFKLNQLCDLALLQQQAIDLAARRRILWDGKVAE